MSCRQSDALRDQVGVLAVALGILLSAFIPASAAFACGGIFDVGCNLSHGGLSPDNVAKQAQQAAQDAANAVEKARQDAVNAAAKAAQDAANTFNELQASLLSGPALEPRLFNAMKQPAF